MLDQILRELQIKVLPRNLPEFVEVDVTDLTVGHSIHVRDISVPDAEVLDDPDSTVCTVGPPRVEVAPAEEIEEVEEEMAEPELIRKPKEEEAEGAGEEGASSGEKE